MLAGCALAADYLFLFIFFHHAVDSEGNGFQTLQPFVIHHFHGDAVRTRFEGVGLLSGFINQNIGFESIAGIVEKSHA